MDFSARRYDLDALRVVMFGLLIPYHVSLIFASKPFILKSDETYRLFDVFELVTHPWRMLVLFLLSGVATAMMVRRYPIGSLWMMRTKSILLPFAIGLVLFGAPQAHVVNRLDVGVDVGFLQSWYASLTFGQELVDGKRLAKATLYHLWFLLYLWAYVSVLLAGVAMVPGALDRMRSLLARGLDGTLLWLTPILFLTTCRFVLYPIFGETLIFATDIYAHVIYGSIFVLGYLIAFDERIWERFEAGRRLALGIALLALLLNLAEFYLINLDDVGSVNPVVRSVGQWCAVMAIFGYARAYASRRSPVIAYLNKGVLSYYLTQQVIIVFFGYWLYQAGLLEPWTFLPITLATVFACVVLYEVQSSLRPAIASLFDRRPSSQVYADRRKPDTLPR